MRDYIAEELARQAARDKRRVDEVKDPESRWLARREAAGWRALRARRLQLAADDYANGAFAFAELYG